MLLIEGPCGLFFWMFCQLFGPDAQNILLQRGWCLNKHMKILFAAEFFRLFSYRAQTAVYHPAVDSSRDEIVPLEFI